MENRKSTGSRSRGLGGDTGIAWPQIMAASTVALAPVLIATFFLQRHIAAGLTAGAVKG